MLRNVCRLPSTVLIGAALAHTPAPALAGPSRIIVSAVNGADAPGCGTASAPCRSFQYAHDAIDPGGEIQVLSPGDYGPVRILKSVSIINDGVGTAGVMTTNGVGNAIVIDGGVADKVYLRGLAVEAPPGPLGLNGVLVNTGGTAILTKLTVRRFNVGVNICPIDYPARFSLSDSFLSENNEGVAAMAASASGSVAGVIERVTSVNNVNFGLMLDGNSAAAPTQITIVDSVFSNNTVAGIYVMSSSTATSLSLRGVTVSYNVHTDPTKGAGIQADGASVVMRLAHSTATGNNHGVTASAGAAIETYGDNNFGGNIIDPVAASGGSFAAVAQQ